MTIVEQRVVADKRYRWKVSRAKYHNDLIDAALEWIGTLNKLLDKALS